MGRHLPPIYQPNNANKPASIDYEFPTAPVRPFHSVKSHAVYWPGATIVPTTVAKERYDEDCGDGFPTYHAFVVAFQPIASWCDYRKWRIWSALLQ